MEHSENKIHISSDEANSEASPQGMNYVPGISVMLTVASMSLIWFMGTLIF